MTTTAPFSPTDRFALVIEGLLRSVAGSHRRLAGPLILLICKRLRRIAAGFAAVAAQVGSGTLRAASSRPERRPVPTGRAPARPAWSAAGPPLPRGFAWLLRLVPEGAAYGSQLQALLSEPEMATLISAAPQIGRLLRPLCRMLAVEPTPELRRKRLRGPAPDASAAAPDQTTAPGEAAPDAGPGTSPARPPSRRRAGRIPPADLRWPPESLPVNRPPFPA